MNTKENLSFNMVLRFILEIVIIVIYASWGFFIFNSIFMMFFVPFIAMLLWGIFRVEGDPGKALIGISGHSRLVLECLIFMFAIYFLIDLNQIIILLIFILVSLLHYYFSKERIKWLFYEN